MISTQCVAHDLHTNEPGHLRLRVGDSLRRSEEIIKKSWIAPLNTIRSSISSSSMCINAFTARQEKRGEKQSSWNIPALIPCFPLILFTPQWLGHSWLPSEATSLASWLRRPPREQKIPGTNPACAGIFPGSSHTSDWKIGTPVTTLPGAWRYRFSTGTGRPGVSILWLGEVESLICYFYLSVAARKIAWADPSLR